uniref:Uncharacterized protein n=1 Tax=Anguilla anguilla TaxID=7936 RepID=A0A0E9UAG3_ANGAN
MQSIYHFTILETAELIFSYPFI